ncbi:MAG: transglutaminase domain-containing protein [Chitinispirillaceae bacterium]|nr:transglutaminase domain-containing protein [Chitinispirillaceae bacterium]
MKLFVFLLVSISSLYAGWVTVDSTVETVRVPVKNHCCWIINSADDYVGSSVQVHGSGLVKNAERAVAIAPEWQRMALIDKLISLPEALQETYARIITDAKDPYIDEIAFTIAHLPLEVINSKGFYPELIRENVLQVYRADSVLEYVSIIDSGNSGSDRNYFSTTSYNVIEKGSVVKHVLPRDIYYWYVVFPKLQGELPAYINKNSPNPTSPSQGKFWRTYLWDYRESGYNALCDTMKGITFLWANKVNSVAENGALGRLSQWCNLIMPWGGGFPEYRWPQPVYLYHQHKGTCSEHGWFASAAARTVLIPVTLTKASRYDHKWNEFYDGGRWIDWEPINGWIDRMNEPSHANDYWADPSKGPLNGCFNWRGDGFIQGTTEHYTPVCTLDVNVKDSKGLPVDGARITIDADGAPGNFLLAGWTGSDGFCRFLLGDDIPVFTGEIQSRRGTKNKTSIIKGSVAGKRYLWDPILTGSSEKLKYQIVNQQIDNDKSVMITFSLDAQKEFVYGKNEYALFNHSFPCTFTDERKTGCIDLFICNSSNYEKYSRGELFEVVLMKKRIAKTDSFIAVPDDKQLWYVVVSSDEKANVTGIVDASVHLKRNRETAVAYSHQPIHSNISVSYEKHKIRLKTCFIKKQNLKVKIFTTMGKPVKTLFCGLSGIGPQEQFFLIDNMASGVYYCRVESQALTTTFNLRILK